MNPNGVTKAGEAPYVLFRGGSNRWGDFSATVVDPTDDLSFWTIQEFAAQSVGSGPDDSRWGTSWALKSRASAAAPTLSMLRLLATASGLLLVGALVIHRRARHSPAT